jgi:ribose transport system permease protein
MTNMLQMLQAKLRAHASLIGIASLLLLLFLVGASLTDRFARLGNLLNVYEQSTDLAFVSIGQTLTIVTGGIDLSVGPLISLVACLTSGLINGDPGRIVAVVAAVLALAAMVGLANAGLVIVLGVHPLIVTLGTGAVLQGLTLLYTLGPTGKVPAGFRFFAYGRIAGIPLAATLAVTLCMAVALFAKRVALGRFIYAVGDDDRSARLVGLPRNLVLLVVYAFCSICCAVAAIFLVGRFGVGQPYTGANYTLASITPVIVGGTSLSGGRGSVVGTLLGAYLIALLNNLLNFMDVSKHYQLIAQALIIILAVSVYIERRRTV